MPAPLDYVVLCGDADGEQEEAARQPLKPLRARRVERLTRESTNRNLTRFTKRMWATTSK